MLGVPASPGAVGYGLLALGILAALAAFVPLRSRFHGVGLVPFAGLVCVLAAAAAVPYVLWRIEHDIRFTSRLHGYDAAAAGPVQAYLPGYLVDGARRLIPAEATYATVVSPRVPWEPARAAFPSLALETLFPRRSVADPRAADYVLAWGVDPSSVAPVSRVWVARPKTGQDPAVLVGKVER